jgi:hypothetical protein
MAVADARIAVAHARMAVAHARIAVAHARIAVAQEAMNPTPTARILACQTPRRHLTPRIDVVPLPVRVTTDATTSGS